MKIRIINVIILSLIVGIEVANSHIGSPGVVFEGQAGKYTVLVSVNPPDVIPGIAEISIYVSDPDIRSISAKPVYWGVGDEGSPKSDPMLPVIGTPGQYEGIVWFMSRGTASIELEVIGESSQGTVVVPVMATATAQKKMDASLGWTLLGLGLLLVVLMVTIISSSVSDALVDPGKGLPDFKRKKMIGSLIAVVVLFLVLFGGKSWWDSEAAVYQRFMYRAPEANSWIDKDHGQHLLTFQIDSNSINGRNRLPMEYMVPDHGKMMHMFMIKEGSMDVFAHLHPKRKDPLTFQVPLPPVPKGKYLIFGDIVRLNGFTETIADTITVENDILLTTADSLSNFTSDPDDTYIISTAFGSEPVKNFNSDILICGKPGIETPLLDGSTAVFEYKPNESFIAGKLYPLTFAINDPAGKPAELQPYMGMMGHAVVFKKEGGVYVHLHPVGNYSMASQKIIEERIDEDSPQPTIPEQSIFYDSVNQVVDQIASLTESERNEILMEGMEHTGLGTHEEHGATVTFPYAFPEAGEYRIWIQMKRNGQVLNSSFDANVVL